MRVRPGYGYLSGESRWSRAGAPCPVQGRGHPGLSAFYRLRHELRRFLGMVGYYRSLCKNFSAVASPLSDLLSSKVVLKWTPRSQGAFESVKALLTTAPVLHRP